MVIDSGASSHMFFDRSLFFDFRVETQRKVKNANGTFSQVEGVGKVSLLLLDKDGIERCVIFFYIQDALKHAEEALIPSKSDQYQPQ